LRLRRIAFSISLLIVFVAALKGYTLAQNPPTPTFGPIVGGPTAVSTTLAPTSVTPAPAGVTTAPTVAGPTVTATAAATASATPLPTLRADLMGIQADANFEQGRWFTLVDRMSFMGFKWLKIQLNWKILEPTKGSFASQWKVLIDNSVYAGRRGFKIMLAIAAAPDWARPANVRGNLDGPPANPQDLVDFVNAVLSQFPLQYVNAIEIWNEANIAREWTGAPLDGKTYVIYFNAAYKAIRARSGDIVVITAGPAPTGDGNGALNDRTWISQVYAAGLPLSDPNLGIGIHPYGWANPPDAHCCASPSKGWDNDRSFFFLDSITDYRQIMLKNNHAAGKLWATEFGWATFQGLHVKSHQNGPAAMPPSDPGLAWMNKLTEDQQAQYIVQAFALAQMGDLATFMGPMILWNLNFSLFVDYINADKPSLPEAGYSVLDSDTFPRPAYNLLQAAPKK